MAKGTTFDVKDIHWLAGILEGEGTFGFYHMYSNVRNKAYQRLSIQVGMTDQDVVARVARLFNCNVCPFKAKFNGKPAKTGYHACVTGPRAAGWMMTLAPLMGLRRFAKIKECLTAWKQSKVYCQPKKYMQHYGQAGV